MEYTVYLHHNVNPALHSNNLGITLHNKHVLMHCLYYRSIEFKEDSNKLCHAQLPTLLSKS